MSNKILDSTLLSLSQTRNVVTERQLQAIEALWIAITTLARDIAAIVTLQDILLPEEFDTAFKNLTMVNSMNEIKKEPILQTMGENMEKVQLSQLYVRSKLWAAYNDCIVVQARVMHVFFANRSKKKLRPWREDKPIQHIMEKLNREESDFVLQIPLGQLNRLLGVLRQRFLTEASISISGEEAAKYHLEQASQFADDVEMRRSQILGK
ncbi:hypothetical protein [Alicyclobacillus fodiniaquatilis]|uniref:Uncharacterized protein n=1 Tax=Alicyclobacillus fodiniaquatilis TaxID=1661150 RepID=A0ABW4JCZ2_9BACL